jgi:glutathione S-transferase
MISINAFNTYCSFDEIKQKKNLRQLPFGQLPLLQIDGLEIVQSQAIVRYIAKRENIDGKTSADEAKCDMVGAALASLFFT